VDIFSLSKVTLTKKKKSYMSIYIDRGRKNAFFVDFEASAPRSLARSPLTWSSSLSKYKKKAPLANNTQGWAYRGIPVFAFFFLVQHARETKTKTWKKKNLASHTYGLSLYHQLYFLYY